MALRNAQLSYRGSLRKSHCAITWVGPPASHAFLILTALSADLCIHVFLVGLQLLLTMLSQVCGIPKYLNNNALQVYSLIAEVNFYC